MQTRTVLPLERALRYEAGSTCAARAFCVNTARNDCPARAAVRQRHSSTSRIAPAHELHSFHIALRLSFSRGRDALVGDGPHDRTA